MLPLVVVAVVAGGGAWLLLGGGRDEGSVTPALPPPTPPGGRTGPEPVVVKPTETWDIWSVPGMLSPWLASLTTAALVMVLVPFMLLERGRLTDRVIQLMGRRRLAITTKALDETAERVTSVEVDPDRLVPQSNYANDARPPRPAPEQLFVEAVDLIKRKEFAPAEERLRQAVALDPADATYKAWHASALLGLNRTADAAKAANDALAVEPPSVDAAAWANNVLGQIFGSQDVSRAVAQNAAGQTGLDPALLKKMLPMLAMLVAGVMAKQGAPSGSPSGGGLDSLLGGLMGGGQTASHSGAGGLASMLDLNRDGNPLDDIIGMAGRFLR